MEGSVITIRNAVGFQQLTDKHIKHNLRGTSLVAFIPTPGVSDTYTVGEQSRISGVCLYHFLMSTGIVRGVLLASPRAHTILTPLMLKIGSCPAPFSVNSNLQQLGLLIYESADSSVLVIPSEVKSSLLVEVDT